MSTITNATNFPTPDTPTSYMDAIEDALEYYKATGSKQIPKDILEKAIGCEPPYCDSTDIDTMLQATEDFNHYNKEKNLFFERLDMMSQ